jgi:hypothetical protein
MKILRGGLRVVGNRFAWGEGMRWEGGEMGEYRMYLFLAERFGKSVY